MAKTTVAATVSATATVVLVAAVMVAAVMVVAVMVVAKTTGVVTGGGGGNDVGERKNKLPLFCQFAVCLLPSSIQELWRHLVA